MMVTLSGVRMNSWTIVYLTVMLGIWLGWVVGFSLLSNILFEIGGGGVG